VRIAAVYDIHGNLPALEAVLDDIRAANVTFMVVGGDVFPGPMAVECLEILLGFEKKTWFLHGNGDREVIAEYRGGATPTLPEQAREVIRWNALQLTERQDTILGTWPDTVTFRMPQLGDVLFCHATPRNDTDVVTKNTTEERWTGLLDGIAANVVICGHTHMQFDVHATGKRIVNAGSVGMPFGKRGAYWLLLGEDIERRCTRYDFDAAAKRIRATEYPQREHFATTVILEPISEETMLARYGG
jgi:predicted phosphodiesterase